MPVSGIGPPNPAQTTEFGVSPEPPVTALVHIFPLADEGLADMLPIPADFGTQPKPALEPEQRARSSFFTGLRRTRSGRRQRSETVALDDRQREKWLTVSSWVRNIGIITLLFVGWQLWGTAIAQHHSQSVLKSEFEVKARPSIDLPESRSTLIPATTHIPDPPQGSVMAHLQIPHIGLNEYVVSGTDTADLALGPGHYLGTAMPGQAGNVAIAGHRTTHGAPFNRLGELAPGDAIYLTTLSGQRLMYVVAEPPFAVSPSDVTVLNYFGDNRLTLTTCNPEFSSAQRLIVVAAYQPPGATHPAPIAKGQGRPYLLAPSQTSGWQFSLLPLLFLEIGLMVALGLAFSRMTKVYGHEGRWLILVPIWAAALLALFETLISFLPAAV